MRFDRRLVDTVRHTHSVRRPRPGGLGALGDSITAGHSQPDRWLLGAESWVSYAVRDAGVPYTYNAARPNWVTEQVATLVPEVLAHRPAVVAVVTGVNDVVHHHPVERPAAVLESIVSDLREGGAEPLLGTIVPITWDLRGIYPPGGLEAKVVEMNEMIREVGAATDAAVIDFHRALVGRPDLLKDGLHPSAAGARVMGLTAAPALLAALEVRRGLARARR